MDYSKEDVTSALNNIVSSKTFLFSKRIQDFLNYIVTETIEGRADQLNGTTIAQDVFLKDDDFDQSQDTVVRVTARRLRSMLRDYYIENPNRDKVILTVPKGGYKVKITVNNKTVLSPKKQGLLSHLKPPYRKTSVFAALCIFTLLGLSFFSVIQLDKSDQSSPDNMAQNRSNHETLSYGHSAENYPLVAIAKFENQTGNSAYNFLEEGLQSSLVKDLSQFQIVRPIVDNVEYEEILFTNKERQDPYNYVITGLILTGEPELNLYLKLIDLKSGHMIYEDRIQRTDEGLQYFESLANIISQVSDEFAGPKGAIIQKNFKYIEEKIDPTKFDLSKLDILECVLLAETMQKDLSPTPKKYQEAYICLENLLEENPDNPVLLATLGTISYMGAISDPAVYMAQSINPDINTEDSLKMVKRAVEIDPNNGAAQHLLSYTIVMSQDNAKDALHHQSMAYFSNPGDPVYITHLSRRLAAIGEWGKALSLSQEARDRIIGQPREFMYYHTDFEWAVLNNDKKEMRRLADIAMECCEYYDFFMDYIAAIANNEEVRMAQHQSKIDILHERAKAVGGIMRIIDINFQNEDVREKAKELILKTGIVPHPKLTAVNDPAQLQGSPE